MQQSFLQWLRANAVDAGAGGSRARPRAAAKKTAVGVRCVYECYDVFIGQFCVAMFPHSDLASFEPGAPEIVDFTYHFLGAREYLLRASVG